MDLAELYERYFKDVYYFLLGLTEQEPLAEELCQETFVKALKAIQRFDGTKDIRAWLFLHAMPEPYKEVFTLRVFGELPYEKIGRLFGKSSGWARVTFYRAKLQIAAYMEATEHEQDGL